MVCREVWITAVRPLVMGCTVVSFSLALAKGDTADSFTLWTWCVFTWCFCTFVTFLVFFLDLCPSVSTKLPFQDFQTVFATFASLMVLSASVIYGVVFTDFSSFSSICAPVISSLAVLLYNIEAYLLRAEWSERSGFFSSVPGYLKILEVFVACIIFICLNPSHYTQYVALQVCVAIYSISFIYTLLIIIFKIGRLLEIHLSKALLVLSVLNMVMYTVAVLNWSFFSFRNKPRPSICLTVPNCDWNLTLVVCVMTGVNLIFYIGDTIYSVRQVCCVPRT